MKCLRMIAGVLVVPVLTLSLGGCQTINEHRTATGATAGAVLGGVAGALIDNKNPWRGAMIGAAAGGAVGGGIGYVLQKQKDAFDRINELETQQRRVLVQPPPPAVVTGDAAAPPAAPPPPVERDALTIRLSNEVLFPVGSSALSSHGVDKLREIAEVLRQYPDSDVFVAGYTSSEGNDRDNYDLSVRRASVIRDQLIRFGVAQDRIVPIGMGASDPIGDNNTEAGRAKNRRVEINVVPRETAARR